MTALFAERALLPSGWARDVRLEIAPRRRPCSIFA